jgi:hypothetical protein
MNSSRSQPAVQLSTIGCWHSSCHRQVDHIKEAIPTWSHIPASFCVSCRHFTQVLSTHDGSIVCNGETFLSSGPDGTVGVLDGFHMPVKSDRVADVDTGNLPGLKRPNISASSKCAQMHSRFPGRARDLAPRAVRRSCLTIA